MRKLIAAIFFAALPFYGQVVNPSVGVNILNSTVDNSVIGGVTPAAIHATALSASGAVTGAGFTALFASPPAIGGTAPAAVHATTLSATGTVSGAGFTAYMASPPAIGGTTPAAVTATVISNNVTTATNTDNRGTITLTAVTGLGSYTFTQGPGTAGIWTTPPVCLFFDATLNTNVIAAVVTNSSISLTGTALDVINYICWPGN